MLESLCGVLQFHTKCKNILQPSHRMYRFSILLSWMYHRTIMREDWL